MLGLCTRKKDLGARLCLSEIPSRRNSLVAIQILIDIFFIVPIEFLKQNEPDDRLNPIHILSNSINNKMKFKMYFEM